MKALYRKISIVHEFVAIGVCFFTIVIALCGWFIFQTISSYKSKIIQQLEFQAERLEKSFAYPVEQTIYMMQVLISQIRHNHNNLAVIEDVLMRFKIHSQVENILTWTAFSWVDKDFKLTADMLYGIMDNPIDMSDRQYVHLTKQEPNEVHFGKPIYGSTSKVWMIPAGIGVTDNKENYIGSIVIGFGIAALLEKLKTAAINEGIDFALIDKNLEVILQSKADLKGIDKKGNIESVLRTKLLETVNFSSPLPLVLSNINLKKN